MKYIISSLLFLFTLNSFSQQTITSSITHGGIQRSFIIYIPAMYSTATAVPLVLNFHGYGSNMNEQMFYGDFRPIADTAGFIIVHPLGTLDANGKNYWNAGWGGSVDDIDFVATLIDSLSVDYNINQDRVFSTGMSNGGFMSYTLACSLSNRIAAIASVTGTMNFNQVNTCNPSHPMPVMEIHGTSDPTAPYSGISGQMETINNVVNYWVNFNNCDTGTIFTAVPDINLSDASTAEHYLYKNGDNGVEVEHYKIINGAHTWPGSFNLGTTVNQDINASFKIWEFFAKYNINGNINASEAVGFNKLLKGNNLEVKLYPNPSQKYVNVSWNIENVTSIRVLNTQGNEVIYLNINSKQHTSHISLKDLSKGIYFIVIDGVTDTIKKIVVF